MNALKYVYLFVDIILNILVLNLSFKTGEVQNYFKTFEGMTNF